MSQSRRGGPKQAKVCTICGRPFAWRKKWEKVWDEVKYCSDACRARGKAARKPVANT